MASLVQWTVDGAVTCIDTFASLRELHTRLSRRFPDRRATSVTYVAGDGRPIVLQDEEDWKHALHLSSGMLIISVQTVPAPQAGPVDAVAARYGAQGNPPPASLLFNR